MTATAEVVVDLFSPPEHKVLAKLATFNGEGTIVLTPLKRYGFSGASLYKAYFHKGAGGLPFVVKLHNRKAISLEMASVNKVRTFFADSLSGLKPALTSSHGAVAYKEISCGSGDLRRTVELKDLIQDPKVPTKRLAKCFRDLYGDTCKSAHGAAVRKEVNLRQEYKWYFRDHRAKPRIEMALGRYADRKCCTFAGVPIANPLAILKVGFKKHVMCSVGPCHGDLHASNVMLGSRDETHLIDFSWARTQAPILQDFVLMECSLRYMLFPRHISPEDQLLADQTLLEEDGYARFDKIAFSSSKAKNAFGRLAIALGAIRRAAKGLAYADFDEYLAAKFLVLYGLLSYDNYNFPRALVGLGLIGKALTNTQFLPRF